MIEPTIITSIEKLISQVKKDYKKWETTTYPWFRGELNNTETPLLPKLYRSRKGKSHHNELLLLQEFRNKAPSLGLHETPPKGNTDEWLFLAQHSGLPTRLLDWTEGLLVALHFSLLEDEPAIWMLDPVELNRRSVSSNSNNEDLGDNVFPLTWYSPDKEFVTANDLIQATNDLVLNIKALINSQGEKIAYTQYERPRNIGNINIRDAWEKHPMGTNLPIAIRPTYIHARMNAQRSCFTIHGRKKQSLSELVDNRVLRRYVIPPRYRESMRKDLRTIGITHATVFPDLDNLAKDLSEAF